MIINEKNINDSLLDRFVAYCRKSAPNMNYTRDIPGKIFIVGISDKLLLKNIKSFMNSNPNVYINYKFNLSGSVEITELKYK